MKASSTQVVTLWGKRAPAHTITAILITEDQQTLVTGSHEGQISLWDLSPELKISSKQMLFGHTASVTCLAKARDFEKQPYVVSATENGEMCIWSVAGGDCVETTRLPFTHTAICYYHSSFRMTGEGWLLCCGQYNDILVIDAKTLVVLHALTSSHSSDWISCMCLVHSPRIQEDSLIAVSVAGDLKVWDLSSSVSRIQDQRCVHERESQDLDCAPCRAIRFCTYTERLLLVVTSSCWKVYDYCDFSLLWTEFSPSGQCFSGGEVLAAHRLIIWTEGGLGYIYQLLNSGLSRSIPSSHGGVLKETVHPVLLCSTGVEENKSFSYIMGFINERKEPFYKILYSGEASGRITLWHIPDVPASTLDGSPKEIPIAASCTLQDCFDEHSPMAIDMVDHLCGGDGPPRKATTATTSSVYIPSLNKLVCGCADGRIFVVPALTAAKVWLMDDPSLLKDSLPHRILHGHSSSITSLLYLHGCSARFDPSWLVSGSQDSCVIWWDMFTGKILHCFSLQAGPVTDLLLSSENYRFKSYRLVCCLCGDHSVVLLHLQERTCILHARKHLFPVKTLHWHPVQNLLIVGCENDSIYIWDIETGALERQESGEMARAILACGEDSIGATADSLRPALEDDTHKPSTDAERRSRSYKLAAPSSSCSGFAHHEKPSWPWLAAASPARRPFALLPLKTKWENVNVHLLLFDLERLVELLPPSQLPGLKASNSFHSYETLKRAKSTAEKRSLVLKRNRTSGSLSPLDGQVGMAAEEQAFGESHGVRPVEQGGGGGGGGGGPKRSKKPKSSKKVRRQPSGRISLNLIADAGKLLLSCLLPWGVDRELDDLCLRHLEALRLLHPVSLGLVSQNSHLSLRLPGWCEAATPPPPGAAGLQQQQQQHEVTNLFSSKVLELRSKYFAVAEEQSGKLNRHGKGLGATERSSALVYLLSRICFVQRIMRMPFKETSPQKVEPARKWRPSASFGTTSSYEESAGCTFGFHPSALDNSSLAKLISCWRDQSVEVMEAIQAVLLAEVQWGLQNQRKALATGQRQPQAYRELPQTDQAERTKRHPSLGAASPAQGDSCILPAQEGGDMAKRQVLEEPDYPDQKKPHPWMSKVCSCKVC
uniref:WD repeat-containing protein 72 isoform X1 n=1 Tax=Pogona vitticeps TaxID=103695 RepID=A0ABM5EXE3_9SAUR